MLTHAGMRVSREDQQDSLLLEGKPHCFMASEHSQWCRGFIMGFQHGKQVFQPFEHLPDHPLEESRKYREILAQHVRIGQIQSHGVRPPLQGVLAANP